MKIVIEIDEELYKNVIEDTRNGYLGSDVWKAVAKGTPYEERPQGEWIAREDMDYLDENKVVHKHFECNKCGLVHDFIDGHTSQYNFCPQCGTDMKGGTE